MSVFDVIGLVPNTSHVGTKFFFIAVSGMVWKNITDFVLAQARAGYASAL